MVVLASKCYVEGDARDRALDSLRSQLDDELGDLDVTYTVGVRDDDFVSVTISGDDATVARNVVRESWGEVTPHFEDGETYVGTLESWDDEGFVLDAGEPIRIPASELGLGQGTPSQIRDRFGLVQHLPLRFVYGDTPRLADETRDRLYDWTRGDGRVNVNSATRSEVRATVNRAGHARDIVTVERLGLLEQSIVCAEGTDPPGLLSAIGQYLPAELKCVIP
ncbi:DUF2110 family protein [Salinirubrum litoreum]|uniref:DUF2110 family protein n=1 Tax=Salinirubrum litoreum TaxID=1126234 RepID=A0ABD5R861_9EURY|nr:DUF2110 family protein [Salinirubrum litoreum]